MTQPRKFETKVVLGKQLKLFTEPVEIEGQERLTYTKITDHNINLTIPYAEGYLNLEAFAGERDVQAYHVQEIYDAMYAGQFNETQVVIAVCHLGDKQFRINGQHTCTARLYMPKDYKLRVREIHYRVDSPEQLRLLYSLFDRLMVRTSAHATRVQLLGGSGLNRVDSNTVGRILPGFKLWLYENHRERSRITPEQYAALIKHHHCKLFNTVNEFAHDYGGKDNRRAPVYAALFETFGRLPTKAKDFWKPVFDGLLLDTETDPRYGLRQLLSNVSLHTRALSGKKTIDQESLYRLCIVYWNKWREGTPVLTTQRIPKERIRAR